ncbi:MAG: hypothetical protein OXC99_13045 [Chloroflexi bacterium]|nr:hypothetical protein [Chloroflexota bacterium]
MNGTLLEESIELANQAFEVSSSLSFPMWPQERDSGLLETYWHIVLLGSLCRANKALRSITRLLDSSLEDTVSAAILNRHLFECAANLIYIGRDYRHTLPEFLKKSKFPGYPRELEELHSEFVENLFADVPSRRWKKVDTICRDLGWKDELKSIYRVTSDTSHGGSSALLPEFYELHDISVSDRNKAHIVSTGLVYHLRIAEVIAKNFPDKMDLTKIASLQKSNFALGWRIAGSSDD